MELLNGFKNLKDIVNERVIGDTIPVVTAAVDQAIAEHNKVTEDMQSLFVKPTTEYKVKFKTPGAAKLMPIDEVGRARKVKTTGQYEVGLPIRDAGLALGDTRIALVKKTVKEVNDDLAMLLQSDNRWVRDQILAGLFDNAGYTFDDPEHGELFVKGLANQDGTLYYVKPGAETGEEAQHYKFISAMDDANQNFAAIYRELTSRPENGGGGNVISFVGSDLEDEIMNLTAFIEYDDTDIERGANTDRLVGSLNASVPGEVIGKVSRNWIVRWDALPSNTVLSVITSGERPLAMRQHKEAELQGFNRVATRNDDPYYESQFVRIAGFGGWNRVSAMVTRIGGSYTVPTGFAQPMG